MEISLSLLYRLQDRIQWGSLDIRVNIFISCFLQVILVFCASARKRTAAKWLVALTAIAYYLADWITPYTLGIISSTKSTTEDGYPYQGHPLQGYPPQGNPLQGYPEDPLQGYPPQGNPLQVYPRQGNPLPLFASFLLLHLGGPDNLTSLSLGENEKWLKQLIQLISQVYAVGFIFIRFFDSNTFFLPTILVYVAGIMKLSDRTRALYLASSNSWRNSPRDPNPGPDYEKLSGVHLAMKEANLPIEFKRVELPPKKFKASQNQKDIAVEGQLDDKTLSQFARFFYQNCKGFLGGVSFSPEQRQVTRDFFLTRTSNQAFKLLEMMLDFLDKDLHTKVGATDNPVGYLLRLMSTSSITLAVIIFLLQSKIVYSTIDFYLTWILFFGAVIPEVKFLLSHGKYFHWPKPLAFVFRTRRWSESVANNNLIRYSLHDTLGVINKLTSHITVGVDLVQRLKISLAMTTKPIPDYVKEKIFGELKKKSERAINVQTAIEICSQRGDWVIAQSSSPSHSELKWSLGEVEYVKSLLLWHIATDLCYNSSSSISNVDDALNRSKDFCKIISEYMLYLLVLRPTMMAPVAADWQQIFQDTCAEAKRFFRKRSLTDHRQACEQILSVNTEIEPALLKGDASKSVLFDACRLAKQLIDLEEEENRWELMSGVWVELLAYGAVNGEATVHAKQPGQGGELVTFVWLLMNQLGLGIQFSQEVPRTRYKMVVTK